MCQLVSFLIFTVKINLCAQILFIVNWNKLKNYPLDIVIQHPAHCICTFSTLPIVYIQHPTHGTSMPSKPPTHCMYSAPYPMYTFNTLPIVYIQHPTHSLYIQHPTYCTSTYTAPYPLYIYIQHPIHKYTLYKFSYF